MNKEEFLERYSDFIEDEEVLFADGFEEAILGLDVIDKRVIYDTNKMISILMERDQMETIDAIEFLEYNVYNAYVGDKTPIYLT